MHEILYFFLLSIFCVVLGYFLALPFVLLLILAGIKFIYSINAIGALFGLLFFIYIYRQENERIDVAEFVKQHPEAMKLKLGDSIYFIIQEDEKTKKLIPVKEGKNYLYYDKSRKVLKFDNKAFEEIIKANGWERI
ncbi:MAG: hypothetical protein PWQ45_123 [Thermosipho sp. (in: thermotogales)]|nr:hypothetical protein [Thermosipho sp. (in: thermotogales)]